MKYDKSGKGGGGGKFMDNGKGMCSYTDNPMVKPSETKAMCGPGANADQMKANRLLQKAQKDVDSLRGAAGKM
ncbi:MAG TPA: hypothetical protein VIJ14_03700 [Rhabdochlamydiaceae bacterium]